MLLVFTTYIFFVTCDVGATYKVKYDDIDDLIVTKDDYILERSLAGKQEMEVELSKPTLKEQIHNKVALLATLIDRQHTEYQDKLVEANLNMTEDQIRPIFKDKMLSFVMNVLADLKELAELTNNPEESARLVYRHFNVAHIKPLIEAASGETLRPAVTKRLAENVSALPSAFVKLIVNNYHRS